MRRLPPDTPLFPPTRSLPGIAWRAGSRADMHRALPEEVPVAVVVDGSTLAVMMASPGDIEDFAIGFALGEGVVASHDEITGFEAVTHEQGIEARIWLRAGRAAELAARRRFMAGPVGCGLCGIDSLEAAMRPLPSVAANDLRLGAAELARATEALRAAQPLHARTQGTHAAGFLRPGMGLLLAREDVGRHNALDKLIGAMARQGISAGQGVFVMTSRLSVELVQKAAVAGCSMLIAVSAPTAHALRLAEQAGMTLAGFARDGGFVAYARPDRIDFEVSDVA
ncbi:MAG: formate dehydrogenase accessory sulfurtransferase FdhD [Pararhodobacter sp.]|nr:formate dehydrogenase accessory sulfurtransferase FdhD [Pararhodobacter sp.]